MSHGSPPGEPPWAPPGAAPLEARLRVGMGVWAVYLINPPHGLLMRLARRMLRLAARFYGNARLCVPGGYIVGFRIVFAPLDQVRDVHLARATLHACMSNLLYTHTTRDTFCKFATGMKRPRESSRDGNIMIAG